MSGNFYIVATPIGNLQDITERAKIILNEVNYVFCEDTRVTGILLKNLNIKTKLTSCHSHNEKGRASQIIDLLSQGESIAYLSDAGTPGLSDPGNLLVKLVSEKGFHIIPIPGPSALMSLISVCGFNLSKGFYFAGFLPRTEGKLVKLLDLHNLIFAFDSPYRIQKTIEIIAKHKPEANLCIGRELTKKFEEIIRGRSADLLSKKIVEKGEFSIAIDIKGKYL